MHFKSMSVSLEYRGKDGAGEADEKTRVWYVVPFPVEGGQQGRGIRCVFGVGRGGGDVERGPFRGQMADRGPWEPFWQARQEMMGF